MRIMTNSRGTRRSDAHPPGPDGPATLADLARAGVAVFCWCDRCGHSAILDTAPLIAQLGPGFAVPRIATRLRCGGCGARDAATRPAWPSLGQVARHD